MRALTLLFFLSCLQVATADEIQSAIDEGIAAFGDEQYSQAASQFELAAQLLRERSGASLAKALPTSPEGWTTEDEPEIQAVGASVMGGMTSASQTYRKGDSSVNVRIMSDSPLVGQISMLLENPSMVQQLGQKVFKAEGIEGIVTYDEDSSSGTLTAAVSDRFFISVDGNAVDVATLEEFAKGVDVELLNQQ